MLLPTSPPIYSIPKHAIPINSSKSCTFILMQKLHLSYGFTAIKTDNIRILVMYHPRLYYSIFLSYLKLKTKPKTKQNFTLLKMKIVSVPNLSASFNFCVIYLDNSSTSSVCIRIKRNNHYYNLQETIKSFNNLARIWYVNDFARIRVSHRDFTKDTHIDSP